MENIMCKKIKILYITDVLKYIFVIQKRYYIVHTNFLV